jgi:hypothetical protein
MKKIALIMLSLGAVYTAQADAVKDLAAQRDRIDNELQTFAQSCKRLSLATCTQEEHTFILECSFIGSLFGFLNWDESFSTCMTKSLTGSTIGFIGALLYLSIQKRHILYLDTLRLKIQQELYELDRKYEASIAENQKSVISNLPEEVI